MSESAKWFDRLVLIDDFLRNNGAFETAFLSVWKMLFVYIALLYKCQ